MDAMMKGNTEATRMGEVREQITGLERAIGEAYTIREEVYKRLEPILLQDAPCDKEKEDSPEKVLVPLAEELRSLRRRVIALNAGYSSILERLEL